MVLSIIILATSLSLDALGVGVAYGLRRVKIPVISKLFICLFSITYSAIALVIGKSLSTILSVNTSKMIGVLILILMGMWIIIQALFKREDNDIEKSSAVPRDKTVFKIAIKSLGITIQVIKNPIKGDIDKSGTIDIPESLLLGLALSVDAIGVGIGSALAGFSSLLIPFAVGLFQLVFLYIGLYLGEKFSLTSKINKKFLALLPGMLLILLAVIRIYPMANHH